MKVRHVITTAGFTALAACSSGNGNLPSNLDAEIGYIQPEIGQVYNSYKDEFENSSCVTVPDDAIGVEAPKIGQIIYRTNVESGEVLDMIGGSANAKLDLESVDASGSLKKLPTNRSLAATLQL